MGFDRPRLIPTYTQVPQDRNPAPATEFVQGGPMGMWGGSETYVGGPRTNIDHPDKGIALTESRTPILGGLRSTPNDSVFASFSSSESLHDVQARIPSTYDLGHKLTFQAEPQQRVEASTAVLTRTTIQGPLRKPDDARSVDSQSTRPPDPRDAHRTTQLPPQPSASSHQQPVSHQSNPLG